jgi:hypothetical protein
MEKTVKEWFETIEDPEIRAKAFANTAPYVLKRFKTSLGGGLATAFVWEDSPERHNYWDDFVTTLELK